jgi:antitoxin ParD1/3/4
MAALEISIPDDQQEWIAAQLAAGGYANASDYIRELIRRDQLAQKSLRTALIDGERSGVSTRTVSDVARQARAAAAGPLKGRILAALRRSPLTDADLQISRQRPGGRKVDP